MDKLQKLQSIKDSPFDSIGRGNTGYLFYATKEMYDYILNETYQVQDSKDAKDFVASIFNLEVKSDNKGQQVENQEKAPKNEVNRFIQEIEDEYNGLNLIGEDKEVIVKT